MCTSPIRAPTLDNIKPVSLMRSCWYTSDSKCSPSNLQPDQAHLSAKAHHINRNITCEDERRPISLQTEPAKRSHLLELSHTDRPTQALQTIITCQASTLILFITLSNKLRNTHIPGP